MYAKLLCVILALSVQCTAAQALTASDILVVAARDNDDSLRVASTYAHTRGIPPTRVIAIDVPTSPDVTHEVYRRNIAEPIYAAVRRTNAKCVVLCHGIPWQITSNTPPPHEAPHSSTWASVDSELAAKSVHGHAGIQAMPNPYFGANSPFDRSDMLLVTRLDGATLDDALALITRAVTAENTCSISTSPAALIDIQPRVNGIVGGTIRTYNTLLAHTAKHMKNAGYYTHIDTAQELVSSFPRPLSFYWGWYADPNGNLTDDTYGLLEWAPGAVAVHVCSFGARDLRRTQSAVAGLIHKGATATLGTVFEPLVHGWARPHLFALAFYSLSSTHTTLSFAEAAWAATPYLSWQNIVIGDPLLRAAIEIDRQKQID